MNNRVPKIDACVTPKVNFQQFDEHPLTSTLCNYSINAIQATCELTRIP